jgi:hypothetical protein
MPRMVPNAWFFYAELALAGSLQAIVVLALTP